ncbi:hypothetical protein B0H10DRAFT_2179780 [Mycena sp. CBHHK59/15]|nr:hypothetical protein B0H10DRAFT_2179780 [Mycena sp. CBHHK59/15]
MSSNSNDGTATPRQGDAVQSPNETENIRTAIVAMTGTLGGLQQTFEDLNAKSAELAQMAPNPEDAPNELQALRKQIREQHKKEVKEIKPSRAWRGMKSRFTRGKPEADIIAQIRADVAEQVKQQVDVQIQEHIPVSLKQQAAKNRTQLLDARTSLINSEARKKNAGLQIEHLDEGLAKVLKADGTNGKLFPADLRSLLSYDAGDVRELVKEYGLVEDEVREENINRFLSHLGILFQLVCFLWPCVPLTVPQNVGSSIALVHQAYRRLTRSELVLFLVVRNLPTSGSDQDLASRLAHHDFHTYHFPHALAIPPASPAPTPTAKQRNRPLAPDLPSRSLRISWTTSATGSSPAPSASRPRSMLTVPASHPRHGPHRAPPTVGADLAVRFGYVNVLEFFMLESARTANGAVFKKIYKNDVIPIKASRHGRVAVLAWWKHGFEQHPDLVPPPRPGSIAEAVDGASRNGQVVSLEWWVRSGLPLEYTEAALEYASAKNQIPVLEWWKQQYTRTGLPLKLGRVMDVASTAGHVAVLEWWATSQLEFKYDKHALHHASCHGKVEVLDWWLGSGLQLAFDQDALIGATRHNRPEVLEWWDKSHLPIQYRMCDIEEALEDAIGGGEDAREWWRGKGVDFNANDKEWMKLQNLN